MNTGIFATPEQIEACKEATAKANLSMMTSSRFGPSRAQLLSFEANQLCHKYALSHGLPEIEGFYGLSEEGEFVTADGHP